MKLSHCVIAGVAVVVFGLAACGSNTPRVSPPRTSAQPATYSSVQDVINALNRSGLSCTGGTSGTPVVKGAESEMLCNVDPSSQALIDVFPHMVSSAEVLANSVSTGTQQIWTVTGRTGGSRRIPLTITVFREFWAGRSSPGRGVRLRTCQLPVHRLRPLHRLLPLLR